MDQIGNLTHHPARHASTESLFVVVAILVVHRLVWLLSKLSSLKIHNHDILHHARQLIHPEPLVHGILVDVPVAVLLIRELKHEHMAVPLLQAFDADVPPAREGPDVRFPCDG